ncbi:hypothetical protein NE237_008595 [Protea cynaroides]|uniref:Disease resistance R13L4/SHOC-2-like LRR domain-containing protein n=1 Tax=Protea cynaroides TaxID=273540 RepID=A0A9Q0QZG4_9MAGN|nr:hypothetical protein NE237_008595 [Protea cynaroides]
MWLPQEEEAVRLLLQDLQDLNIIQAVKVSSIGITKTYCIPPVPLVRILKASGSPSSKAWVYALVDDCKARDSYSRCIHGNTNFAEELELYKTLRSFEQEVGSFLKRCINNKHLWFLRVLDLEGVYKPSLPDAIGELFNLHHLGLRWTYLDTFPSSIENLRSLQTLDTKHTDIGNYPTVQYMQKLKHFYLNERHPFNQQQRLNAFSWLIWKIEDIQTLKITSKDESLKLLLPSNEKKKLSHVYLQRQLVSDYDFCSGLTTLTLSLTKLLTDPMPTLGKLPKLKLLSLFSKSFMGDNIHCLQKSFPRLRVLKIWKLEELKQWTVAYSAFPKLEELEIRSCKNLQMLPDHVPIALRELKLTAMPKEFTSNVMGKDIEKVAHVSSVLIEDWLEYPISSSSVELYTGWNRTLSQVHQLFGVDLLAVDLTKLLCETKLEEDPMPLLERLPHLMVLFLSFKSFTGKHMLTIQELEKLEELTVEDGAMPKIEELEIRSCRNLKFSSVLDFCFSVSYIFENKGGCLEANGRD